MNNICKLTCLVIIMLFVVTGLTRASEEGIIDPNIPESWNEAPKTATEMGITVFNQSPLLKEKVDKGLLPDIRERLPKDPPVIEPYESIGKYGGTFIVNSTTLGAGFGQYMRQFTSPMKPAPDGDKVIPWFVKDFEYSDDYTKLTLYFREGLKWSDGEPFIPEEEYKFWWDYYINYEALSPLGGRKVGVPEITELSFPDEYTVTFHMDRPFSLKHKADFRFTWALGNMEGTNIAPKHFMQQFHPEFVGEEEAEKKLKELDFEDLYGGFNDLWEQSNNPTEPDYEIPTMGSYIPVERTETYLLYERNPYYPFIDTEGNQLPYVDKIKYNLANSKEAAEVKAITGESSVAAEQVLSVTNIPSYKENEERGDYRTLIFNLSRASDPYYFFNHTHEDESFAEVVRDKRFRQAFSLAIDREDINNKVFYGEGIPTQATIPATSEYFKQEYAEAYAEYDPERARKLLDEMGMKDTNGDGYRETPDGSEFKPELQLQGAAHDGPMDLHEMVRSDLAEVGINLDIRTMDGSLVFNRIQSNVFEMESHSLDPVMPLFGPEVIKKIYAPVDVAYIASPFTQWAIWFKSDGQQGIEPPQEMLDLNQAAEKYLFATSDEEKEEGIRYLLEKQAENIWGIGTVAHPPQPIIVQNKVKNVPKTGYMGWGLGWMNLYNPIQFYIDE